MKAVLTCYVVLRGLCHGCVCFVVVFVGVASCLLWPVLFRQYLLREVMWCYAVSRYAMWYCAMPIMLCSVILCHDMLCML